MALPVAKHLISSKECNMFKKILIGVMVLILIAVGIGAVFGSTASASENEPCVPSDAWTEVIPGALGERINYVWTGGPVDGPPPVDAEGWKPNQGEHNGVPHQQPDGVPYQVGNGNGDWFLWLTTEPGEEIIIEHPAVVCPEKPAQPEPLVEQVRNVDYKCGDDFKTISIFTKITPYWWDDELQEWVLGRAFYPRPLIYTVPTAVIPCDVDKPEDPEPFDPPAVHNQTPSPVPVAEPIAVPTAVDAGM